MKTSAIFLLLLLPLSAFAQRVDTMQHYLQDLISSNVTTLTQTVVLNITNAVTVNSTNAVTTLQTNAVTVNSTNTVTTYQTNAVTINSTNAVTTQQTNFTTVNLTNAVTINSTNAVTTLQTNVVNGGVALSGWPTTLWATNTAAGMKAAGADTNVPDAYAASTVTNLTAAQVATVVAAVTNNDTRVINLTNTANNFDGNGSGLTSLQASNTVGFGTAANSNSTAFVLNSAAGIKAAGGDTNAPAAYVLNPGNLFSGTITNRVGLTNTFKVSGGLITNKTVP